jgi:hypothetical protein
MITMIQPIASGNALRIFLSPPAGSLRWRVLRNGSDSFANESDPNAIIAYEGDDEIFVDVSFLQNEVMAFYRAYYFDGTSWTASATANGTPVSNYEEFTTDVMSLLRSRIEAGMKVEVERGNIIAEELGYVQVYTAPPSLEGSLRFPLITMHMINENSGIRGIGENISGDEFDAVGFDWLDSEGWISDVQMTIVCWSLNSDERIELRKALRRVIIANLPVLSSQGIEQVNVGMQDVDAINGEYDANLYQVVCNFSCIAPVRVGSKVAAISDVTVNGTGN